MQQSLEVQLETLTLIKLHIPKLIGKHLGKNLLIIPWGSITPSPPRKLSIMITWLPCVIPLQGSTPYNRFESRFLDYISMDYFKQKSRITKLALLQCPTKSTPSILKMQKGIWESPMQCFSFLSAKLPFQTPTRPHR